MTNYYHILGVPSNATDAELKAAFKRKALSYHPDKHDGDKDMEELFKQVNEAYQVLSNSYKRSKHDMMLRYGRVTRTTVTHTYQGHRQPQPGRPRYYAPQMSNWKATAYAFLFAFTIALIMTTGMYINEQYKARVKAELLAGRRSTFEQVKSAHVQGDLKQSLQLLSGLGHFWTEEQDMRDFKDLLLVEIKNKGDNYLADGNYQLAISHYDMLKDYSVSNTISYMKKIATAYQGMGEVGKALEVYQMMHLYGYRTASFYLEMGSLYENGMQDLGQALNYYQIGAEMASSEYEVTIGSAYPIVINANMVPASHYDIYMKVAQTHLNLNQYQEAVDAISWTKEIWPDSLLQYEIEARSFQGMGRLSAMRQTITHAKSIDPEFSLD
ncbi:DnaJ domain-containing protein [Reichenbachiella faecimaris]|uniref:DnaJ domain-containing protein n=1 Tax=Reichenbachiella faecimaris TaxID=692418 RepID=A0A1W2GJ05_REIFA|nr:DnaJ domain-containing protein [Reichenbachiella faecimaris]SMD36659.1 DnaJ domain-containing protein [Reichenbachiella faecimaris]